MISKYIKILVVVGCAFALVGCATYTSYMPTSGPSVQQVVEAKANPELAIQIVELSDSVARRALAAEHKTSFSETFGSGQRPKFSVGDGDSLEISVWEAPPAVLFSNGLVDSRGSIASSRVTVLPEQMVTDEGTINMPFVGAVRATGRSVQEIEEDITSKLKSKAHEPQVVVRVIHNASSIVTIVGEVTTSMRMPLTPRGERLLDALAAAGGVKQPVGKITLQLTRQGAGQGGGVVRVGALPLDTIITDPSQNVILQPGDVVTALFQPNSFTVLGATARNEEINFEAQGITLAQALSRAGGLKDERASASGVFVFRFEDPATLGGPVPTHTTPDGKVPVIYQVNLRDPASFFAAQGFPMHNKDVMYVANAPGAELQKFLTMLSDVIIPIATVRGVLR